MRVGHGFDVHKFGGDGPVILGGIKIAHEMGLIAHSDGDVLIHALCDALLGAAAMGDIGQHFPDSDDVYNNIDSRQLLRTVVNKLHSTGYRIGNVDITLIAQAPKIAPHTNAMTTTIAEDLQTARENINIKATTTETLGYTGRKEGIACHAIALLVET